MPKRCGAGCSRSYRTRRASEVAGGADDHAGRREGGQGVRRGAQRDEEREGARRTSSAETARTRDVLHAAVEVFYDRFAAAVDVAFEGDDGMRVSLLSLVPRRVERRAQAAKPPASDAMGQAANG